MAKFQALRDQILDIFYPKFCLGCGQEGEYVCVECFREIKRQLIQTCPFCKIPSLRGHCCSSCAKKTNLSGILIACRKEDKIIKQLVYECKYRFVKSLAENFSWLMIETLEREKFLFNKKSILVPVPLHSRRLKWRGFNQSILIAQKIAGYFKIPIIEPLSRAKHKKPQMEIKNRKERQENIKGNIFFKSEYAQIIVGKKILLIDDIATTGATLEECAMALKTAGAKSVWAIVLLKH